MKCTCQQVLKPSLSAPHTCSSTGQNLLHLWGQERFPLPSVLPKVPLVSAGLLIVPVSRADLQSVGQSPSLPQEARQYLTFLWEDTGNFGPISVSFAVFLTFSPPVILMISKIILDQKRRLFSSGLTWLFTSQFCESRAMQYRPAMATEFTSFWKFS